MLRTFNMGIGLIVACAGDSADTLLADLRKAGEPHAARIGHVAAGGEGVRYVAILTRYRTGVRPQSRAAVGPSGV